MKTWIKQNGTKIELNEEAATIAQAKANGWKEQVEELVREEPIFEKQPEKPEENQEPPLSSYKETSDMRKKRDPESKTGGKTSKNK